VSPVDCLSNWHGGHWCPVCNDRIWSHLSTLCPMQASRECVLYDLWAPHHLSAFVTIHSSLKVVAWDLVGSVVKADVNSMQEVCMRDWGVFLQFLHNKLVWLVQMLFLSTFFFKWGGTKSARYCGNFWPIVQAPDERWGWLWSNWWNEDWQGKPKYSEKTCPSATLSTTNPTWLDPGSNPGLRGGKPATFLSTCLWTELKHQTIFIVEKIIVNTKEA
jgi:hypothetical protein